MTRFPSRTTHIACPHVTYPTYVGFSPTVLATTFASQLKFHVIITFLNYAIKNLIVVQKLEPRTVGLKPI